MRELIGKGLLTAAAASSVLTMSGGYAQATDSGATAAGSPGLLSGNSVQAPVEVPVNVCGNTVNPVGVLNPSFGNGCGNSSGAHAAPHGASKPRPAPHGQHTAPRAEPATHPAPAQAPPSAPSRPGNGNGNDHGGSGDDGNSDGRDNHASSTHGGGSPSGDHGRHQDDGGSSASGAAVGSPGLLSGNLLQAPLDIPVNVCGNSVDLVGLLNPAFGNSCANGAEGETPHAPLLPPTPIDPLDPSTPPGEHEVEPPNVPVAHDPMLPERPRAVEEAHAVDQLAETGSDRNLLAGAGLSAGLLLAGAILYRRNAAAVRV
ncbi:chaplin family protein [Streptomyces sp. NBC_01506]|uniref:chaplin n=1 Tax=Streptomyces sp. NBC_01506 TaxID=2903887 RepID=UPI003863D129